MDAAFESRIVVLFPLLFLLALTPQLSVSDSILGIELPSVRANLGPTTNWLPSGPTMNYLFNTMYTNRIDEYKDFSPYGVINFDFPDVPLTSGPLVSTYQQSPYFLVTQSDPNSEPPSSLVFNMANTFWTCPFTDPKSGNSSSCGKEIRQGIAHLIDKTLFTTQGLAPNMTPMDDPVGSAIPTPNPCVWDDLPNGMGNPDPTSPSCIVGAPGGTAYHLLPAQACGVVSGCSSVPTHSWTPGLGTPDFCAAANHFVAALVADGKDPTTCVLQNVHSSVCRLDGTCTTFQGIHIFVRTDSSDLENLGGSFAEAICAVFTGSFSDTCCCAGGSPEPILQMDTGVVNTFPGFTAIPGQVHNDWWIYTDGPIGYVSTGLDSPESRSMDASAAQTGNDYPEGAQDFVPTQVADWYTRVLSQGANPVYTITSSSCGSGSTFSYDPSNYAYLCDTALDNHIHEAGFAPCLAYPGDPTLGESAGKITFANCPGTTQLTMVSASYKVEDYFGQEAYSIPIYSSASPYAYANNGWSSVISSNGVTFNYFNSLDAFNPNPATPGTIRQAFSQSTDHLNPFFDVSPWDLYVTRSIYDSLGILNPMERSQYLDWMTTSTRTFAACPLPTTTSCPNNGVGYNTPAGTTMVYRFTLRNDIYWQTGQLVTAWDVAFSFMAYAAFGVSLAPGLDVVTGIKIISPAQVDVEVKDAGFSTLAQLGSAMILPGRDWSRTCGAPSGTSLPSAWDTSVGSNNFATANSGLLGCIAPSAAYFTTGIGNTCLGCASLLVNQTSGTQSNVDPQKAIPAFDPMTMSSQPIANPQGQILIGSGPWVCKSSTGVIGNGCSSSGTSSPPSGGGVTLTRYGIGTTPGEGPHGTYFRSAGTLALWAWTGNRGDPNVDFLNLSSAVHCYGAAIGTPGCTQWQQGIGAPGGSSTVGVNQLNAVLRFVGVNWISPYDWTNDPPVGIATPFPPVLYEGSNTLYPARMVGCASAYPAGGYDC